MADLTSVKVGDKLATPVRAIGWTIWRGPKVTHRIHTVDKITPTQIVCGPYRFRKATGRRVGDYGIAEIATPEILEQHHKEAKIREAYLKAVGIIEGLSNAARMDELSSGDYEIIIREFGHLLKDKK